MRYKPERALTRPDRFGSEVWLDILVEMRYKPERALTLFERGVLIF